MFIKFYRTKQEIIMQVNSKQTSVYPEICGTRCETCLAPECQICQRCLTDEMKQTLESAYLEHVNRHECRRVFPPPMVSTKITTKVHKVESHTQFFLNIPDFDHEFFNVDLITQKQ